MKSNPVVHFEMGYENKDRMCTFYASIFGWQMQRMGPEMGDYVVAVTAESYGKSGRPKIPGAINGGFYQKTDNPRSQAPAAVVSVDDIRATMKAIEAGGGKILGAMDTAGKHSTEPQDIPGVGLWISAMDTEANRFSVLQPKGM